MERIIALLTDFGTKGQHYVAQMKGVILKINPNAKIIDLSHSITPYSIVEASYILKTSYKHFPENTIFIIVVDPGVGGTREILALETKSNYVFIAPNNGILSSILSEEIIEHINIQNNEYFNRPVSSTFHGRDIMAPVGAHISNGVSLNEFGLKYELKDIKSYPIELKTIPEEKEIQCTIQYIDSFGNGTTNIPIEKNTIKDTSFTLDINTPIELQYKNKTFNIKFGTNFASTPLGTLLILKGSTGFIEISINQGNAAKDIGFKVGDIITFNL